MVELAKRQDPIAESTVASSVAATPDITVPGLDTLLSPNASEPRAAFFKDVKSVVSGGSSRLVNDKVIDETLKRADQAIPGLDANLDRRITSNEIHAEVMKNVRALVAETPLNKGTVEEPQLSLAGKAMLWHLEHRQSFLLPVLKEQRIFNNLLGAYTEGLKAFDTAFPKGFHYPDVLQAVDGLDGSKRDGQVSLKEIGASIEHHPKESKDFIKHVNAALIKVARGGEGICEQILAKTELVQSMEAVDPGARDRIESAKDFARAYREALMADSAGEMLSAVQKLSNSVSALE